VKRRQLVRHLEQHGCQLLREGPNHSIYVNRSAGLAKKICKDLGKVRLSQTGAPQGLKPGLISGMYGRSKDRPLHLKAVAFEEADLIGYSLGVPPQ